MMVAQDAIRSHDGLLAGGVVIGAADAPKVRHVFRRKKTDFSKWASHHREYHITKDYSEWVCQVLNEQLFDDALRIGLSVKAMPMTESPEGNFPIKKFFLCFRVRETGHIVCERAFGQGNGPESYVEWARDYISENVAPLMARRKIAGVK